MLTLDLRYFFFSIIFYTLPGDGFSAIFLISQGASVIIVTPERADSALHLLATSLPDAITDDVHGSMNEVADLLLDSGLDPNLQNNQG